MPKSNFYFEFFKYLDGFKDLAFVIDPDSREILFLNKSACNELHISLDDILDKHILISDVFAKDKHAKVFNKNNLHTHSFYNWVFWDKNSGSYVNETERAAVDFEISWYYRGAEEFTQDFVRIMLLKSDLTVGCAVIKIEPTKSWYSAAVCEKILYTQPVPIQQAESEIEQIVLENQ